MMGTGTFAEPTLEALLASGHAVVGLVTQPDKGGAKVRGSTRQVGKGMKAIAQTAGVPVYQPESINTPEGVEMLRSWRPDLLVVAAYGQILKREVLEAAALGGINVHASLLPKYRGAAPINWAIFHGERETGVTIIRMSVGLDAGDMLDHAKVEIRYDETAGEVEARLAKLGASLAVKTVNRLAEGPVTGERQDPALVTKAPKLTKEHGLIDWSRPASAVVDQIRAMHPWPTAYTFLHREGEPPVRWIVHKASSSGVPQPDPDGRPGRLLIAPKQTKLLVWAGDHHAVEIHELQPADRRRMPTRDYLRGRPMREGDFLGPEKP
jgi:methionyl-tRNA formyltransferase